MDDAIPDGVMYAQVEQAYTFLDYPPFDACVRLVGVDENSFQNAAFNSDAGCRTYFIDIAWCKLLPTIGLSVGHAQTLLGAGLPEPLLEAWPDGLWVRVTYSRSSDATGAYAYEIFADAEPIDLDLKSLSFATGPSVSAPPTAAHLPTISVSQTFGLYAFHVGQGMCALLKGTVDGILLDAGAGTPVSRAAYRAPGPSFVNDLKSAIGTLDLQAIVSHPDSDHWRLLDWDTALCGAVKAVYTPSGTAALAFKSVHVKPRVHAIGSASVSNGAGGATLLEVHRSQPARSDRNGECLVVETHCAGRGLFPGDYVYDRMATDANLAIRALASRTFDAVMVPHHGDAASASVTVSPAAPGTTHAFFSAGNHAGYKHPTAASLRAHLGRSFDNIDKHWLTDVRQQPLP